MKAGMIVALATASWVLIGVLAWAIVTDHGRFAAACVSSAVGGFAAATFVVAWRVEHELRVERGHNDRWNLADTRYELDLFPSPLPGPKRELSD